MLHPSPAIEFADLPFDVRHASAAVAGSARDSSEFRPSARNSRDAPNPLPGSEVETRSRKRNLRDSCRNSQLNSICPSRWVQPRYRILNDNGWFPLCSFQPSSDLSSNSAVPTDRVVNPPAKPDLSFGARQTLRGVARSRSYPSQISSPCRIEIERGNPSRL